MSEKQSPYLIALVVLLFTALNSLELFFSWKTHVEQYAWVPLLVWCFPIFWYWLFNRLTLSNQTLFSPALLVIALLFSLTGMLGSLNTLKYIGLAFALCALVPWSWVNVIWLASSLMWMPAFGWLALYYFSSPYVFLTRLTLITTTTALVIVRMYRPSIISSQISRSTDPSER